MKEIYPSLGGVPSHRFFSWEAVLRSIFSEALDPRLQVKSEQKVTQNYNLDILDNHYKLNITLLHADNSKR